MSRTKEDWIRFYTERRAKSAAVSKTDDAGNESRTDGYGWDGLMNAGAGAGAGAVNGFGVGAAGGAGVAGTGWGIGRALELGGRSRAVANEIANQKLPPIQSQEQLRSAFLQRYLDSGQVPKEYGGVFARQGMYPNPSAAHSKPLSTMDMLIRSQISPAAQRQIVTDFGTGGLRRFNDAVELGVNRTYPSLAPGDPRWNAVNDASSRSRLFADSLSDAVDRHTADEVAKNTADHAKIRKGVTAARKAVGNKAGLSRLGRYMGRGGIWTGLGGAILGGITAAAPSLWGAETPTPQPSTTPTAPAKSNPLQRYVQEQGATK